MNSDISYEIRSIVLLNREYNMILVDTDKVDQIEFRVHSESLIRCYGDSKRKFKKESDSIFEDVASDLESILEISTYDSNQIAKSVLEKVN